jgi:diaminopimelate epimerase
MSISTDGKVKAWTIAKGLEHSTLITLKRASKRLTSAGGSSTSAAAAAAAAAGANAVGLPAGSGAKAAATVAVLRNGVSGRDRDALISRNTGGMSFDFSSTDSRIYLAGKSQQAIMVFSTLS